MPISKYFKGAGVRVMANLHHEYGEKKGTEIFYAMANKDKSNKPAAERRKKKGK